MTRTIGIGIQNFERIISNRYFYIDKTNFIKEWWENGDAVTLIARPRRFGKTLAMDMTRRFFSVEHSGQTMPFHGLSIWQEETYRSLQGTYPVIFLSFADVKDTSFPNARKKICQIIEDLYNHYDFLLESGCLNNKEKAFFHKISYDMEDYAATTSLRALSRYLSRYFGKNVIILLDEYDTPLQEAYVNGYWQELTDFIRNLFNSTFKTNPYLERAIMTGITRVSRESIFSDLNNLEVVTATSEKYETSFGFTHEEVELALKEYGLTDQTQAVKDWYDGFTFGCVTNIYNPWSILNYLDKRRFAPYWANTSSNRLVDRLIRQGDCPVKMDMETLLRGGLLETHLDEQIVFEQLDKRTDAIWSLLLASGYLRVENHWTREPWGQEMYALALTNREVRLMFSQMIQGWFSRSSLAYNDFIKAMLSDDVEAMNAYMNHVALHTFSYFDTGNGPSEKTEPERFYHGFVLGLMVELAPDYLITSNRESGLGRYDVMLEPKAKNDKAFILEFKVKDENTGEITLEDTVNAALKQIEDKEYEATLISRGIHHDRIRKYGFGFEGKRVLIGSSGMIGRSISTDN